ncbi:MAG: Cna B-type domain-containing protein [Clostridia bacterium]|nr:Cna B-type domain-containing protein [Clostridia bacterium]
MKKVFALLCTVLCLALLLPTFVAAEEAREVRIYAENAPKVNVAFDVYLVGTLTDSGVFSLSAAFENAPVSPKMEDASLAATLAAYAQSTEISPYVTVLTDAFGHTAFSPEVDGVFLVLGEGYEYNDYFVEPQPTLFAFPNQPQDGIDIYSFTISPKLNMEPIPTTKITRHVLKIWDDEGSKLRPEEIVVSLLKDGERYATATLNAKNNWSYTFLGLDARCVWTVVEEDVPEGYSFSLSREGETLIVTNTLEEEVPPPPQENDPPENLPQTGMVVWPLGLFCVLSLICLCIGLSRPTKEKAQ